MFYCLIGCLLYYWLIVGRLVGLVGNWFLGILGVFGWLCCHFVLRVQFAFVLGSGFGFCGWFR